MRKLLIPIAALLISDALLLVGHGIQVTVLPLRAELEGFTTTQVALTGSTYFIGFVVGCLLAPQILRRVGHIRAFAVLGSTFSATVLLFPALPYFAVWLFLRFLVGVCISGLYMLIESWLNTKSTAETRGTILSMYTMINLTMIVVGQQALNYAPVSGTLLFGLASVMLSLAIIPVSLTLALAPTTMEPVRLNFPRVWHISHAALLGAGISGLVTGAFWSLGPVFARGVGMDTTAVTLFMSAVVLGGAIFQLPLGKLSDHFERRLVLLGTAIVGVVISLLIPLLSASTNGLLILAPFWGGAIMTLYAISLAHAADGADAEEFVMVGSCLLITFGLSSACGAPLAGLFMELMGANGIFIYTALCLGCLAVAIAIRRRQRIVPDMPEEAEPFRAVADSSPAMFALDPRTGLELETESDGDAPFNTATSDHRF